MIKCNGYILDADGFIVFSYTTRFCNSVADAEQLSSEILNAWESTHSGEKYYYEISNMEDILNVAV